VVESASSEGDNKAIGFPLFGDKNPFFSVGYFPQEFGKGPFGLGDTDGFLIHPVLLLDLHNFLHAGISLSVLFLLPSQPVDADQSFHLPEFGVPGDHGGFLLDGCGHRKAVGIGKSVLSLDFGRLDYIPEGVVGPVQGQAGQDGIQKVFRLIRPSPAFWEPVSKKRADSPLKFHYFAPFPSNFKIIIRQTDP
jgi:hypothetical protein